MPDAYMCTDTDCCPTMLSVVSSCPELPAYNNGPIICTSDVRPLSPTAVDHAVPLLLCMLLYMCFVKIWAGCAPPWLPVGL